MRYEAVNAMLLNEFLKEHHKVEEQERKMSEHSRKAQPIAELKATERDRCSHGSTRRAGCANPEGKRTV
jgi:hypothetical protein